MLTRLQIKDFTLIDALEVDFYHGFSVITGETGAGKSIILGALGLLLGQRADAKTIRNGKERCTIEAHFSLENQDLRSFFEEHDIDFDVKDCILRRELNSSGKSRSFINDTPVSLVVMKELGEQLVDIHSQHQNLLLAREDFQLAVVDIVAGNAERLQKYQSVFAQYDAACRELRALKEKIEHSRQDEEFLRFRLKDLLEAKLVTGEEESLEQEADMLAHAEEIKSGLFAAYDLLDGGQDTILEKLKKALASLSSIAKNFPQINDTMLRLDTTFVELKDMAYDLNTQMSTMESDPLRLEELNARIDRLQSLKQKHHVDTVNDLLTIQKDLEAQLAVVENSDVELEDMQKRIDLLHDKAINGAKELTASRLKAAKIIEKEISSRLVPLNIPNVRFQVLLEEKELCPTGNNKVSFMFSANKNSPLLPVSEVASGGEIARVMLSLKAMISGKVQLPTIIFDEIDTGVSGKIAEKMAQMMLEMGAGGRQVICITHLPQIAATGSQHYKVYKEDLASDTLTKMVQLTDDGRVEEIAQMLSGSDVTEAAINNAKSLLRQ